MQDQSKTAGHLLGAGIRSQSPMRDRDLKAAIETYANDITVQGILAGVASGLGLDIVDVDQNVGVILAITDPSSPFLVRPSSFATAGRERVMFGVVLVAIATDLFPETDALEDTEPPMVPTSVDKVHRMLESLAQTISAERKQAQVEVEEDEETYIWETLLDIAPIHRTEWRGDHASGTLSGLIQRTFKFLEDAECLKRTGENEYTATIRYHQTLRYHSNSRTYIIVSEAIRRSSGES